MTNRAHTLVFVVNPFQAVIVGMPKFYGPARPFPFAPSALAGLLVSLSIPGVISGPGFAAGGLVGAVFGDDGGVAGPGLLTMEADVGSVSW